jgi:uncharacterized protein YcfL
MSIELKRLAFKPTRSSITLGFVTSLFLLIVVGCSSGGSTDPEDTVTTNSSEPAATADAADPTQVLEPVVKTCANCCTNSDSETNR